MKNLNKKDIWAASIIGEIVAVLILIIGRNLGTESPGIATLNPYFWHLLYIFPVLCAVGLVVADILSRIFPPLFQFAKFVLVGGMNFLVDLGVLNFLIFATGIALGAWQSAFKAVSFVVAVINSYFWNKGWVFKKVESAVVPPLSGPTAKLETDSKQFFQFLAVSVAGFLINVGVDYVFVNLINPMGGISEKNWAQLGAAAASIAAMMWNFIGYKIFVFKEK